MFHKKQWSVFSTEDNGVFSVYPSLSDKNNSFELSSAHASIFKYMFIFKIIKKKKQEITLIASLLIKYVTCLAPKIFSFIKKRIKLFLESDKNQDIKNAFRMN